MLSDSSIGHPGWTRLFSPFHGRVRLALSPRRAVPASRLGVLDPATVRMWISTGDDAGAETIDFPLATGTVRPGERRALVALVRALRPARVLEIGTYLGASTAAIAMGLAVSGGHLVTVDLRAVNDPTTPPWPGDDARESPRALLQRLGLAARVTFVQSSSLDYLARPGEEFDLIFLDGDHEALTVYAELALAACRVRPGGYILLHDYFPNGQPIGAAQNFLRGPYLAVRRALAEVPDLRVFP